MSRSNQARLKFRVRIKVGREFKNFFTFAKNAKSAAQQMKSRGKVVSVTKEDMTKITSYKSTN